MKPYPTYNPGDKVRLLRLDTVPNDPSPEMRERMAPSYVWEVLMVWPVEIDGHPNFQSLDLVGWPFAVNCDDVELVT